MTLQSPASLSVIGPPISDQSQRLFARLNYGNLVRLAWIGNLMNDATEINEIFSGFMIQQLVLMVISFIYINVKVKTVASEMNRILLKAAKSEAFSFPSISFL